MSRARIRSVSSPYEIMLAPPGNQSHVAADVPAARQMAARILHLPTLLDRSCGRVLGAVADDVLQGGL